MPQRQIDLFNSHEDHPLVEAFQGIDPDNLSPRQALELLYTLKTLASEGKT